LAYLDDLELLDDGYTIPRVPTTAVAVDQLLPDELIAVLYVLALPPDQARLLHAKGKEPKPHIGTNELQNFLRAVRRRKLDYATSIGEDKSLLESLAHDPSSRRRALAVQVRLGEKEIFVQLENALQGYLDGQEATNSAVQTRKERDESSEIQNKRRKL
ncbi:bifunctional endoribonuclease/protein kinase ire1, partial [Ascosphaera pollenicola]